LEQVGGILADNHIESAFVEGNVMRRDKAIRAFKAKDSEVRVILLSIEKAASGTNLMEASHVILLDPVTGTKDEAQAVEAQAIGRAHRQGQQNQVTIVRFLINETVEHDMYIRNYLQANDEKLKQPMKESPEEVEESKMDVDQQQQTSAKVSEDTPKMAMQRTNSGRPKLLRTSSVSTLLANSPSLRRSGTIVDLLEQSDA